MTLADRLAALGRAIEDVRALGLDDAAARASEVLDRARERAGHVGDVYVMALAGGTGVGKSSVLNALAGEPISEVRAVRPTTERPVAWVPEPRREELAGLLEWLGVGTAIGHGYPSLGNVAILDLPDFDSVRLENRAVVDALLPRIDALVWVVDPEKYDDERLHAYLRGLTAHGSRMRFVLNKVDRLSPADLARVRADLTHRLESAGIASPRVLAVSARDGAGMDELRRAIASEADAKALVTARLTTDATSAHAALARAAGVESPGHRPLVDEKRHAVAVREAVAGALAVVDPPGVARQMQAAVMARARRTGGSLLGRAVRLLSWLTGQEHRRADPEAYVRAWRSRGTLGRAVNPVRALLVDAVRALPPESRPAILRAIDANDLEDVVGRALDSATRDAAEELAVPRSLLWPVIGAVQLVIGAVFAFAVAWYVTLFLAPGMAPVTTADVPILGAVPLPLLLLAGSVAASAVLGFLLSAHARWIGGRRARRVADRVRACVTDAVSTAGTAGLDRLETIRSRLATDLGA
jgi:putative protein kinase ArgK-like GTPase of G3E family